MSCEESEGMVASRFTSNQRVASVEREHAVLPGKTSQPCLECGDKLAAHNSAPAPVAPPNGTRPLPRPCAHGCMSCGVPVPVAATFDRRMWLARLADICG